tara:strand:- start:382 stop:1641 length:1260 start_codon:yes stop_codon:yes gene_type:complete
MFDLNMHTARLLMDEPFFASVSRRIDKRPSTAIPTAGILVNKESAQFEMLYNPEFFGKLSDAERRDVLKHEFYHVVFLHVTDRLPDGVNPKLWNIATDLAINSHLHNLPKGCLIPGEQGTKFESMPRGKSSEWYLEELKNLFPQNKSQSGKSNDGSNQKQEGGSSGGQDEDPQSQGDDSKGQGNDSQSDDMPDSFDDHSGWGDCPQEVKDMARERLKDIVKKAAEDSTKANSWGSVSASCRASIMKVLESKIDWRKTLRYFVKTSQRSNKSSSIKRINRRYPYIHSGRKINRVAKVAISIDQSGSVCDRMLGKFFAELNKLAEIAEFTVIPFDTEVGEDHVFTWKKGQKRPWQRVMYGGTCFNAPTEYVNERSFDGHIILTDMYAPKPKASKCQRMWMTTPEYAERPYFSTTERVVAIK